MAQQPLGGELSPDLKDIAPPVELPLWPWWTVAIALLLGLALVGAVVFLVFSRWRKRPSAPPPTPREIALGALEQARHQVRQSTPYEFSILVSDILRIFLVAQYGVQATNQTSPEFLADVSHTVKFSIREKEYLGRFLGSCDLIKFARVEASEAESERLLEQAFAFVKGEA